MNSMNFPTLQGGLQKAAYLKEAEKLKADNLALKAEVDIF